jgi:hypothetical protein
VSKLKSNVPEEVAEVLPPAMQALMPAKGKIWPIVTKEEQGCPGGVSFLQNRQIAHTLPMDLKVLTRQA